MLFSKSVLRHTGSPPSCLNTHSSSRKGTSKRNRPCLTSSRTLCFVVLSIIMMLDLNPVFAQQKKLEGIGYREQNLQQAKNAAFASNEPEGMLKVSYAGGTNIFIKGQGFEENPQSNLVILYSRDFSTELTAPLLNEDDAFQSAPLLGYITYRLPSLHDLFDMNDDILQTQYMFYFDLSIQDTNGNRLECGNDFRKCRINYFQEHTPRLHYLSPPVVYFESYTQLWFDPKSAPTLLTDLQEDEKVFVSARIGPAVMDFENTVTHEDFYGGHGGFASQSVIGKVGKLATGPIDDITLLWEVGKSYQGQDSMTHCTYDNQTCYKALSVPTIFDISSSVVTISGGQNLTVTGFGFNSPNIVAIIDGEDCAVTQYSLDSFSCKVAEKSSVSVTNSARVGSNGIRREIYDYKSYLAVSNSGSTELEVMKNEDFLPNRTRVELSFEKPFQWNYESHLSILQDVDSSFDPTQQTFHDSISHTGSIFRGWFVAPATTRYRFYQSCHGKCNLWLSTTPDNETSPTKIIEDHQTDGRRLYTKSEDQVSDWYNLTEGQNYYIEALTRVRYETEDAFSVAVEIEQSSMTGHHNALKEIQTIRAYTGETNKDTIRITVENQDEGRFKLLFKNDRQPNGQIMTCRSKATASWMDSCTWFISSYCGGNDVNATSYDADGLEVSQPVTGGTTIYEIKAGNLLEGQCANEIVYIPDTSSSSVTIQNSEEIQRSSPPLGGRVKIQCETPEGVISTTDCIRLDQLNQYWAAHKISKDCIGFVDKIRVEEDHDTFGHDSIGVSMKLIFEGEHGIPGQFKFIEDDECSLTGNQVTLEQEVTQAAGTNIFYDAIPFEMLRTYETEPQLIVTVDGSPAVCHNLTCDVTYIETFSEITGSSFNSATGTLTITGTDLPTSIFDYQDIKFAKINCVIDTLTISSTGVECTLEQDPVCGVGVHDVQATHRLGRIPNSGSYEGQTTVTCSLTAMSLVDSTSQLNLLGQENITFTGSNLPTDLTQSTISITFDDANSTVCNPVATKTNEIICTTNAFRPEDTQTTMTPVVFINGQTISHSLSMITYPSIQTAESISPASVNPVLVSDITLTLTNSFPYTLNKDDFTFEAYDEDDETYRRQVKVNFVDDSAKTLTGKFQGAQSGTYKIALRHSTYGLIDTSSLILDVNAYVTGVSPTTLSKYGGTLITISGSNFGTEATDNPVQLYPGAIDCYVESTSESEIQCRPGSDLTDIEAGSTGSIIVFLKLSEEAKCDDTICKDTMIFTDNVPVIDSVSVDFDTTELEWIVTVEGFNFTGNISTTSYSINGVDQETMSVSSTQAKFKLIDVSSRTITGARLLFDIGTPQNHSLIEEQFEITPKTQSVTPRFGSARGQVIRIKAPGVTVDDESTLKIITQGYGYYGSNHCEKITVPEYGVVLCQLKSGQQLGRSSNPEGVMYMSIYIWGEYGCDPKEDCSYKAKLNDPFPHIYSSSKSGDFDIVITGRYFQFASDVTAKVSFLGIEADSVTLDSDTQATATFDKGVPVGTGQPKITFTNDTDPAIQCFSQDGTSLDNSLSVGSYTTGLQCSFAGGCSYEVQANGLTQMISHDQSTNFISVCDELCVLDDSESTAFSTKCKLPKLSTTYSNENFGIATESENLNTGSYFGTFENNSMIFDSNLIQVPTSTATEDCHVGIGFKSGHVGMISQVKWYMADMDDNTQEIFADSTQFQGSNDEINWQTIFTMDSNVHAGWNYHEWTLPEEYPAFRFFRFYSTNPAGCQLNEVVFRGVEVINEDEPTFQCDVKVNLGDSETALNTVEYSGSLTSTLTGVSPRYGTVTGGTLLTFTGTNFPTETSLYTITLDGIDCPVDSATSTSVTCTTGDRPGLVSTSTEIFIEGQGLVANNDFVYTYASAWSDDTTWGGLFAPGEGESIYVPAGLNLLVDLDETPLLNAVFVEGSILFVPDSDPTHHRKFDAHYLFITNKGSRMEVGTEEFPYTSKLTITMHSSVSDPYLPIYGNKVIGCRECILDMHGVERNPVWTYLDSTVARGDTQITLASEVDWQVGEQIAIAPTGYNSQEGEHRTITAISTTDSKSTLTLDQPLTYPHFAQVQTFGDEEIDTRAEVGLLSRNVVFRGDPDSQKDEYGAAIFLHSQGDDSLTARISYIELFNTGQAFKLGRYAIHFHMIGNVHSSYVKGNSIHQGNNRAVTMHGVHHLRVLNNVIYKVKGHNIFIEDAVETNNYCKDNLIISVIRSWSLLNTDQTPAGFWITHPNNHLIGNHIGGSDRYGIWYDLKSFAQGPSAHMGGCPHYSRVGINDNNAAHSVGRYGLRIFHRMEPRTYPCRSMVYDEFNTEDPYWQNPPIETNINNFTSWKNNRDGAIAQFLGYVKFNNFKVADNLECGIQQSIMTLRGEYSGIFNSLIIGTSAAAEEKTYQSASYGAMGPRSEYWVVRNTSFYGFSHGASIDNDGGQQWPIVPSSAFGFCSHCTHHNTRTQGAHEYKVSGIYLHDDVDIVVRWQIPYNGIIKDEDGSVTGLGPNSWLAGSNTLRHIPECEGGLTKYGGSRFGQDYAFGVRCDSSVEIRQVKVSTGSAKPQDSLRMNQLQFLPYDDSIIEGMTEAELEEYSTDLANRGSCFYFPEGWAAALATGHKYRFFFSSLDGVTTMNDFGTAMNAPNIDWEYLAWIIPYTWTKTDAAMYFTHTYTEYRSNFNMTKDGLFKSNNTIPALESQYVGGQNFWNNETQEIAFIINGKLKASPMSSVQFGLNAYTQIQAPPSLEEIDTSIPDEEFERLWSDVANWPNQTLPKAGEDVEIKPEWNMILDIPETPVFRLIKVHGRLTFSDSMDIHLQCYHISIRGGQFKIGSVQKPFEHKATITMHGKKTENAVLYPGAWSPGTKKIANAGLLQLIGKPRTTYSYFSRLQADATKGSNEIFVDTGLDWTSGDRLVIGPTSYSATVEQVFVSSYDSETGQVALTDNLKYYHFGQAESTGSIHNGVDMRAEVMLMTRQILIQNDDDLGLGTINPSQGQISANAWSGRILTGESAEFLDGELVTRVGQTFMNDVEVHGFGGMDTSEAAINFVGAKSYPSHVINCVVHNSLGWGTLIKQSKKIEFRNNFIFNTRPFGLVVDFAQDLIIDSNIIMKVVSRELDGSGSYKDKEGGMAICAVYKSDRQCTNITTTNNIVAAARTTGYWAMAHECSQENTNFVNNTVHSCTGHGAIFRGKGFSCFGASQFIAYKVFQGAAVSMQQSVSSNELEYHHMTMIDNIKGFMPIGTADTMYSSASMKLYDNKIYGEYAPMLDCPSDGSFCHDQYDKVGWTINGVTTDGRAPIPLMEILYPYSRIMSMPNLNQRMTMERNQFINFQETTLEGKTQKCIGLNKDASDYIPIQEWIDTKFVNVSSNSLAYLLPPNPEWAVIDDCGQFPCTGPLNVLMDFKDSIFQGTQPDYASSDFQVISNNDGFSPYVPNCNQHSSMNAYVCQNQKNFGMLLFESQDADKLDKSYQPVYISQDGTGMNNKLNSFMDHAWDGFYTSQKRFPVFPSLILAPQGQNVVTDITFTGPTPEKMKFQLIQQVGGTALGTTVRIAYPDAISRSIFKNGELYEPNPWDDELDPPGRGPVTQSECGENRYIGIQNILEFYITSECDLEVRPRNAIATMVRMEFTLESFFSSGGTTLLIDRLSSSLGIHASDVKIVSVYEGSLVVNYELTTSDDDPEALEALRNSQDTLLTSSDVNLGAPILNYTSNVVIVPETEPEEIQSRPQSNDDDWENSFITYNEDGTIDNQPVFPYMTEQNTIVTDKEPQELQKRKSPLIPIVISVIIVIALAISVSLLMNRFKRDQQATQIITLNDQELSEAKANGIDLEGAMKQNADENVARDSMVNSVIQVGIAPDSQLGLTTVQLDVFQKGGKHYPHPHQPLPQDSDIKNPLSCPGDSNDSNHLCEDIELNSVDEEIVSDDE